MNLYAEGSKFFHGSVTQNLKVLTPQMDPMLKRKVVWASYYRPYAAIFTLPWKDTNFLGSRCDPDCQYWIAEVSKNNKAYINKPCSIYIIEPVRTSWDKPKMGMKRAGNKIYNIGKEVPDAFTIGVCKVIKEFKYKNVLECYMKNQVGVVFIQ